MAVTGTYLLDVTPLEQKDASAAKIVRYIGREIEKHLAHLGIRRYGNATFFTDYHRCIEKLMCTVEMELGSDHQPYLRAVATTPRTFWHLPQQLINRVPLADPKSIQATIDWVCKTVTEETDATTSNSK